MVNAIANQPERRPASPISRFKVADPQYILSTDPESTVEDMENALWQQIGGHEIISLIRREMVDGTNKNYSIISDLEDLAREYFSQNIIPIKNTSELYFNSFNIIFNNYLPSEESLASLSVPQINPVGVEQTDNAFEVYVYVADIADSMEVEVQSISVNEVLHDTIYVLGENS